MLATIGVSRHLVPVHPGLDKSWEYEPVLRYTNDFGDEQRRRRGRGSGEQQVDSPWLDIGQQPAGEAHQSMSDSPRRTGHYSDISPRNLGTVIASTKILPHATRLSANSSRPATASSQVEGISRSTTDLLPSVAAITSNAYRGPETTISTSPTAWRSTGIHSILNPTSEDTYRPVQPSEQKTGAVQHVLPALSSPRIRKRGESRSPGRNQGIGQAGGRGGRRILTPKSPGLRAASLGPHRSPSIGPGASGRAALRFGDKNRMYTAESGERHDSAVIPPVPSLLDHHTNPPAMYSAVGASDSYKPSVQTPITGYSAPNMQSAHSIASDAQQIPAPQPSNSMSPSFQHSPAQPSHTLTPVTKTELPSGFTPIQTQSARQGEHYTQQGWMLALEGGDVGVVVDNQQASKMADEKRKRNAGASARFRARRKEREKEASQTISGLQQDLREMAEDRDFYVNERNFYRDLFARNNPGPLPQRPPSPQLHRISGVSLTGHESDISSDYGRRETTELPEQRLRPNDFQTSFAASQPPAAPVPPQAQGSRTAIPYHPSYQSPSNQSYAFSHSPPSRAFGHPHSTLPPAPQLPPPRAQPRDLFQPDVLGRNWNPTK